MSLSIVIPVYRDDENLRELLQCLREFFASTSSDRTTVVVVDGGCSKDTAELVAGYNFDYLTSPLGRGVQIARGIAHLECDWYWILHADSTIETEVWSTMQRMIKQRQPRWGRFDVAVERLPWVSFFMNLRSRLTKICTGDQGMFLSGQLLREIGGFPQQALMEDIEVSKRLKNKVPEGFYAPRLKVGTSAKRWRRDGTFRTVLGMWGFRLRYWLGADPQELFSDYYDD